MSKAATGPKAVGELASEFFHKVSKYDPDCEEFDKEFESKVSHAMREIEANHMDYGATRSDNEPPSAEEVREALKDAAKKLHKSPGTDGVCNWMLVWGTESDPVLCLRQRFHAQGPDKTSTGGDATGGEGVPQSRPPEARRGGLWYQLPSDG